MSYEQAMKHFKNHAKDKYYQQCGGAISMFKDLALSDFQRFQNRVKKCGGVWLDSGRVYFSQTRDEYSAAYYPNYPEHTCGDYIIVENNITKKIVLYAPYATEYGSIKREYKNWNEVWKSFKGEDLI